VIALEGNPSEPIFVPPDQRDPGELETSRRHCASFAVVDASLALRGTRDPLGSGGGPGAETAPRTRFPREGANTNEEGGWM